MFLTNYSKLLQLIYKFKCLVDSVNKIPHLKIFVRGMNRSEVTAPSCQVEISI